MQDPSSPTRDRTRALTVKVLSPNHWIARVFPSLNVILSRSPGFCLYFSLPPLGNSNPIYPRELKSVTPANNGTHFLLCPVAGGTQNSPLAVSDPNLEKTFLCPLVEAFLHWVLKALDQPEPRAAGTENKHFAEESLVEIARGCTPTSTPWFLSVRVTLYIYQSLVQSIGSSYCSVMEHFLKES